MVGRRSSVRVRPSAPCGRGVAVAPHLAEVWGRVRVPSSVPNSRRSRRRGGDPVDGVLVINADLGPLHRVTVKHAIRMLLRRVAEIHEAEPDRLIGVYPMPRVVRLVQYVVTRWRYSA